MVNVKKGFIMRFCIDRLITLRTQLGITKAEAARRLNMSAMGYGRYEKGEREPSFQTVSFIAQTFGTSTDYLYGITDDPDLKNVSIEYNQNPELFDLVQTVLHDSAKAQRLLAYYNELNKN